MFQFEKVNRRHAEHAPLPFAFLFLSEFSRLSMFSCRQVKEKSKEIYCSWFAFPPMVTPINASLYQKGQQAPIEEKTVRKSEVLFTGLSLSFGSTYTISIGSMETDVDLRGLFAFTSRMKCVNKMRHFFYSLYVIRLSKLHSLN